MRLKSHILTLAILVLPFVCVAQRNANHWIFGDSVWLEFVDTGIVQRKANISTREASSSINKIGSDSLLFYASPSTILNAIGEIVVDGLRGHHSATQGALFLQHPDNEEHIHFFSSDDIDPQYRTGLYHHIIDPSGYVNVKNDTLLYKKTEQLTAVNHRNNRDIWIASHLANSDSFYLFLVTDQGLLDCPIIHPSTNIYSSFWAEGTILKFSPNGDYLAGSMLFDGKIELYHFDNESGTIDDQILISNVLNAFGIEFSADSKVFYVSSSALNSLIQFDLSDYSKQKVADSRINLANESIALGHIQLAVNGKIYIAIPDSMFLGVVNTPSVLGSGCDYQLKGLNLNTGKSQTGLPSFNQSYFYTPSVDFSYRENCNTLEYEFEAKDTFNATTYTWYFTNPDSSATDTKTGQSLSYQFNDTGQWAIELIASNGTKSDTVTKIITIRPAWKPDFLGKDTFYCAEDKKTVAFNLKAPPDMHCVHWMGDPAYGQPDSFVVYTAGTYFVKVTNKSFCTTFDTITIKEIQNPSPPLIVRIEDTLVSDADSVYYRWYKDDVIQTNDTLRNLVLRDNGTYFLKVVDDSGCAAISNSILVDNIAVNEKAQHRIQIYPNPTNGTFTIKGLTESALSIQVFDHKGALVTQLDPVGDTHDIAKLPEGFYVVRVLTNGGLYQARLVLY